MSGSNFINDIVNGLNLERHSIATRDFSGYLDFFLSTEAFRLIWLLRESWKEAKEGKILKFNLLLRIR